MYNPLYDPTNVNVTGDGREDTSFFLGRDHPEGGRGVDQFEPLKFRYCAPNQT